ILRQATRSLSDIGENYCGGGKSVCLFPIAFSLNILFTLKNAHLSICNKLNIGKKLVDWRGIPEHQKYRTTIRLK
ncbi:MAG: hypothetical protein ACRER2_17070, partial [Methylococcales bacterium]